MYYGAFLSGATLADRQMSICKPTEFRDFSIATGFTEQIRKHCGDATSDDQENSFNLSRDSLGQGDCAQGDKLIGITKGLWKNIMCHRAGKW
jgi:hypothetical protein